MKNWYALDIISDYWSKTAVLLFMKNQIPYAIKGSSNSWRGCSIVEAINHKLNNRFLYRLIRWTTSVETLAISCPSSDLWNNFDGYSIREPAGFTTKAAPGVDPTDEKKRFYCYRFILEIEE